MMEENITETKKYTIELADRCFEIASNDNEEHIRSVQVELNKIFNELSPNVNENNISPETLKVALKLADEIVRIRSRISACTHELELILKEPL